MKKKGMFVLPAVLLCGMALLGACSEDDTPLEGGGGGGEEVVPPGGEGGDVAMEGTGDVSQVKIGSQSAWWAETDERWLQLSLMGGSGGETVDVIAAYNTSPEARTGEVRVYQRGTAAPGAAATQSGEVQVISVTQEGNAEAEMPPCFTEFWFEDGEVRCTLYGGSEGGRVDTPEGSDMQDYTPTGGTVLATGVDAGQSLVITPYVRVEGKDELRGYFTVGGVRTANTLVIRQGYSFTDHGEHGNDGSADVHFVYDGKLYYGGGLVSYYPFGGTGSSYSWAYDLNCYDPATGEDSKVSTRLPATRGAGFGWRGSLYFIAGGILYRHDGGDVWTACQDGYPDAVAVRVAGDEVSVVGTDGSVWDYVLSVGDDGLTTGSMTGGRQLSAGYLDDCAHTTDDGGTLWVYDNVARRLFSLGGGAGCDVRLEGVFDEPPVLVGADGGSAYVMSGSALHRVAPDGTTEMLRLIVTKDFDGGHENIGGTIYCFGGVKRNPNTTTDYGSKEFKSFTPSAYVPMSLSIVPGE